MEQDDKHMIRIRRDSGGAEPETVRVWLLGGFRVSVGSRTIEDERWRLKKARAVVKLLALAGGHRLHREQVAAALWPELDTKPALNNLHRALHFARAALGDALENSSSRRLSLRDALIELCPDGPLWVDVEAFEEAAASARRSRDPAAYRAAIELYTGDLLPEDLYEAWTEERRADLRRRHRALLVGLAAAHEERGEYAPAIEALRRSVEEEATNEEAHAALMRLYALAGRRHEALLQYGLLRTALREGLNAEPGDATRLLREQIRTGELSAPPPPRFSRSEGRPEGPSSDNLPAPLTSFVGREIQMTEVRRALSMTRLLTLSGAGGSGKTRLAVEVARELAGSYPGGIRLVELAALSDPELVPQSVAEALGVREQPGRSIFETLSGHIRSNQTLLVLDNCEHVVDAAASLVGTLLKACPRLRILATSREALGVPGETLWPVPPLSVPDATSEATVEGLATSEAVRLFVERARSRLPDFDLTPENAESVANICRRLDGIPLAIELACARMGALAVEQVAQRLEDSLKLLSVGGSRVVEERHRTMRATVAWSHDLLDEKESELFGRLSVFAGGWRLEAAEEVCSGSGIEHDEVLVLLTRLVDKSLVVTDGPVDGAARYRMLEPVREYAREKLEGEESPRVDEKHARYYLALAERVEPELSGARPVPWLELLDTEYGNLRAALSWALDEEAGERAEIGLRLAAALARFWDAYGPAEGRRWLEKGLARSGAAPASVRARALNEAGFIAVYEGDPKGMALLEESLALYKEIGDLSGAALAINNLGHAVVHGHDRARMASLRDEVEALLARPLEKRARAHLLVFLGFAAALEMDFRQMRFRIEEALALFRELGDVRNIGIQLPILGVVVLMHDTDFEKAAKHFEEGLILQRDLKYKSAIYFGLLGMAGVMVLRGQPARAAKLSGAAEALRESIGLTVTPMDNSYYDYDSLFAPARDELGEAAFEEMFSEGRAMSVERAIEYTLSNEDTEPPARTSREPEKVRSGEHIAALTRRQREVAMLVGQGFTNRQIASKLGTRERTVETHVGSILKKLGLRSRTQIATWIADQEQGPWRPGDLDRRAGD